MEQDKVRRRFLFIAGPVTLFLILIGFTYAFFNYTRTGTANTVRTGRIYFLSEENNTLNITNLFPLASSELDNADLDQVSVRIQGDTTYSGGEEYEITIVGVNNTVNGKSIPLSFVADYIPTATGEVIGSPAVSDYYTERGSTTAVYQLTQSGEVENGKQVLVGYIPKNGDIDGTLKISAYLDASRIAITDTLEGTETASAEYENGTISNWVSGRTVLTTTEWNTLQNTENPISFKIRAESNEGIWVEEKVPTIASCPGCKYMYVADTSMYTTWNTRSETPSVLTTGLYNNYEKLIAATGKNYFLGVKLNNNNELTNAYVCGVKDNEPFCIEGYYDNSKYATNQTLLQGVNLYNNSCAVYGNATNGMTQCGPWDNSSLSADTYPNGIVNVGVSNILSCIVYNYGGFKCEL